MHCTLFSPPRYSTRFNDGTNRFLQLPTFKSGIHRSKAHNRKSYECDVPTLSNGLTGYISIPELLLLHVDLSHTFAIRHIRMFLGYVLVRPMVDNPCVHYL